MEKSTEINMLIHLKQQCLLAGLCVLMCTTDLQFEQLIALVRRIMRIKEAAGQIWMRLDET